MKETQTIYRQACARCVDGMYHVAYVALVNATEAEAVVTELCVKGIRRYARLTDPDAVICRLYGDLYRACRRKLRWRNPTVQVLPPLLQSLTKQDRLLLAMALSSGLGEKDMSRVTGMTVGKLNEEICEICGVI